MSDLAHLRTPSEMPWSRREHGPTHDDDLRDPFARDRDRILHAESFRRLQHKTQLFIVTESDLFRTRITHTLEVAQIGRSISRALGLSEPLTEAICLGHDVGHTPFGHVGETTLNALMSESGGWNSNTHSLVVLERLETQYPHFLGLDLTWATREGIARHETVYDEPNPEWAEYPFPSLEAQVANVADVLAYATHDLHDALEYGLISVHDVPEVSIFKKALRTTEGRFDFTHPEGGWPGVDVPRLKVRSLHRDMIDILIRDVTAHSATAGRDFPTLEQARQGAGPIVGFSGTIAAEVRQLADFTLEQVIRSPLVARQNAKAATILRTLYGDLVGNTRLLPRHVQERLQQPDTEASREVAYFLASLSDRAAIDLYNELYAPTDRAMGHHVR